MMTYSVLRFLLRINTQKGFHKEKNMKHKKEKSGGAELGSAVGSTGNFLTILFCALRACGIIHWSWFWIMSPIFFSWVLLVVLLVLAGVMATMMDKDEEE